jgi:hypothetical protein
MNLLPGEETLKSWMDGALVLTNYKVFTSYENKVEGKVKGSIMLDQVSMVKVASKSKPYLIVLGIISILVGIFRIISYETSGNTHRNPPPYGEYFGLFFIGAILVGLYFLTRKNFLSVCSAGGNIEFQVQGNAEQMSNEFISSVEEARFNLFYKNSKPSGGQ